MKIYNIYSQIFIVLLISIFTLNASNAQEVTLSAQIQQVPVDKSVTLKSYAILMSMSNYDQDKGLAPLTSSQHDIDALSRVLIERLGYREENIFKVTGEEYPSDDDIFGAFADIDETLPYDANILFYYVGHGFTFKNKPGNYIVPTNYDTRIPGGRKAVINKALRKLVPLEDLVATLVNDSKRGLVVFYNACRNDALDRTIPFSSSALALGAAVGEYSKQKTTELSEIDGIHAFFASGRGGQSIARLDKKDETESPLSLYGRVLVEALAKNPSISFRDLDSVINNRIIDEIDIAKKKGAILLSAPVPSYMPTRRTLKREGPDGFCLAKARVDKDTLSCTDRFGKPRITTVSTQPKIPPVNSNCEKIVQQWGKLKKSETSVSLFANDNADCRIATDLADYWNGGMQRYWTATYEARSAADDKCSEVRSFLQQYPDTNHTKEAQAYIASVCVAPKDNCGSAEAAWEKLEKTKTTVKSYALKYKDCTAAIVRAVGWRPEPKPSVRETETVKADPDQGKVEAEKDNCLAADTAWKELEKRADAIKAYAIKYKKCPSAIEQALSWKPELSKLEVVKTEAKKIFEQISAKTVKEAGLEIQKSSSAFEVYRPIAKVLQQTLRLQGCSVSEGGKLNTGTVDGFFGAGSQQGLRKYNVAIAGNSKCNKLREVIAIGSKVLQKKKSFLETVWLPDALYNIGQIEQCKKSNTAPICGCSSDLIYTAKNGQCVKKICKKGQELNITNGKCYKPPTCKSPKVVSGEKCVCSSGYRTKINWECYKPDEIPKFT